MSVSVQYLSDLFNTLYKGPVKWGNDLPVNVPGIYFIVNPYKTNDYRYNYDVITNWRHSAVLTMTLSQIIATISSYWLHDETILYIGKAGKSNTLRK